MEVLLWVKGQEGGTMGEVKRGSKGRKDDGRMKGKGKEENKEEKM